MGEARIPATKLAQLSFLGFKLFLHTKPVTHLFKSAYPWFYPVCQSALLQQITLPPLAAQCDSSLTLLHIHHAFPNHLQY
jgi:hypothetical protein